MWELKVEGHFSAAHHLLNYEGDCENQHGHNWKIEAFARGNQLDQANILIDFKIFKKELNKILNYLDHTDINTLPDFENISPSSEILSKYIYTKLKNQLPQIYKVSVWETEKACASYFE
ncbi:MAG: 6-carboxytetrahydropterin synthase [Candidatus Gastranaerophilales bacterium]|nr:6-carboxytetrahydropterin synthase [Candidatus Gastranaerophilales bacterium]